MAIKDFSIQLLITLLLIGALLGQQLPPEETSSSSSSSSTTAPGPARPPPRVKLNKCCHLGEYLNATTRSCIAGNSELWVPMVYLIQQQRFFEPIGASPRFMKFTAHVRPVCQEQQLELFSSRLGNAFIFPNGTLSVRERLILVEPQNYCVDRDVALVCLEAPAAGAINRENALAAGNETAAASLVTQPATLRMRKCCGKWGSYDTSLKTCNLQPSPPTDGQLRLGPQLPEGSYQTSYGLPECVSVGVGINANANANVGYAIAGDWRDAQLNRSSGEIRLSHHTNLSASQYCLEHTQREGEVKIIACSHHFSNAQHGDGQDGGSSGLDEDGQSSGMRLQKAVLTGGILISVVFLAATLVAGFMLPAVHHALHWRCQICYVFCLLVGKVLLAIEELNTSLMPGSVACLLLAVGMQFFFLSAFFWLNTMCFNIWWTFRDFRPSSLERNQEALRLLLYSVYAWGVPLLISTIAACVDQLPETTLLRPGFGQLYCWFDNRSVSIFAYFYGPIGLLLCANIALFISTTHQLTCGLWKRDDVKSSTEKSALGKVCLKLVVVMGVTWIADIMSWLVGGPHGAWFVTDLINALQGVFIFIVVGCQPQVWTACRRICCPRLRHDITNTTNGVQHSSSSQGLPSMAGCGTEFTQNTTTMQCSASSTAPSSLSPPSGDATTAPPTTTTTNPTMPPPTAKMETVC
ncbi:probable G-protein coupled receptor Mth-like 1 [Drosophila pseudoobscura]|uniref:Probable G-protein coupled receptor Mth-like 1 n=1 Tax=Drosophila pseudoobscura pseudoobscura TaxID=46245 RepID=A0A6I8UFI2_DROPS|nr:probable G-protein coupled receptor Mth-like 1 [Drosophila pseudoobscura]